MAKRISLNLAGWVAGLLLVAGLIGLGGPVVQVLFGRGAFDMNSVQATHHALVGYSLGLPALCCIRSLIPGFYAFEDAGTPVWIATVCLLVNIGSALLLMQEFLHVGLALAVSLAGWVNFLLLGWGMRRKMGSWFSWEKKIPVLALLSLCIGLGSWYTTSWGGFSVALIPLWALAYLYAAKLMRVKEADMILGVVNKLFKR